jgi:flagellar basal body P-ring protein FlgI
MGTLKTKTVLRMLFSLILLASAGCETTAPDKPIFTKIDSTTTIGNLVEIFTIEGIPIEGYALVGGLLGTGSSQCPQGIRQYLKKYIHSQLPDEKNVSRFIDSKTTAVVKVEGYLPSAISTDSVFDVKVSALTGTQTTSLKGGSLYGAELWELGKFGITFKPIAQAEGPIYIDMIDKDNPDENTGYVLGGGSGIAQHIVALVLRQPDFKIAAIIRNRINDRFGDAIAHARSSSYIEMTTPPAYAKQKTRFISLIKATYISETAAENQQRIKELIFKMATAQQIYKSEIALEAIGTQSIEKLKALLASDNEEVRFHTARCLLNMGNDQGLDVLREIAHDPASAFRLEALAAVTVSARRNDAATIARAMLRDPDFNINLAAYESLRSLDDLAVRQYFVADKFIIEEVSQTNQKIVYITRSGRPRIALFGAPMKARKNIFIQSDDGNITINAPPGQNYVQILRKHPTRPNIPPIQLKSSFDISDIIRTLCEKPQGTDFIGLNASYTDAILILRQMTQKGALDADFKAGPLPKINQFVK